MKKAISNTGRFLAPIALLMWLAATAFAAAPGITGTTFNLTAQQAYLNQPDGEAIYSWGYGCATAPAGFAPTLPNQTCPSMQVPGPTLIVHEGTTTAPVTITVNLTNNLPTAAGNTSILFPGLNVTTNCPSSTTTGAPQQGLLTCEAVPGSTVTYTITNPTPGTHAYYSGTQGDLQIEMGLYGAIIVLPAAVPANCTSGYHAANLVAQSAQSLAHPGVVEGDFRLSQAAYDHPASCYDREYLFQWAEMDTRIHRQAQAQVAARANCTAGSMGCSLDVQTEPYHPAYFLINGRSMPDLMDPNFAGEYPHQPYNGNPHMHPGELTLIRTIGQGRWQHPFHEHANHVRILARDGNLILSSSTTPITYESVPGDSGATAGRPLAGQLMFNTDTTPGEAFDGIFYFTGRGLNWDPYGHHPVSSTNDPLATLGCTADANGYNTGDPTAVNFFEWCQDHNKPVQVAPFGDVAAGGPATLPDPNVFTNGQWYGGTPYLGPDASLRASMQTCAANPYGTPNPPNANCTTLLPSNTQANPANERGWAFMWHSHNEREITTNNVFPGGMLMMMLVDSREFVIDESQ
ncbi:MAG TPA: multicopper oxidase domain-containing protein [Candidatus Sulfotelmatobacter sp.]|jgi:FtsP/CotA-like multicopper oxidase with cupredoxin domain|nr:multicopper oxidase domain-containing protein [Candidatus Sulfotelmatobacter sp.]